MQRRDAHADPTAAARSPGLDNRSPLLIQESARQGDRPGQGTLLSGLDSRCFGVEAIGMRQSTLGLGYSWKL